MGAPRVLIIMAEEWTRALLRAALRDQGYDAVSAPGVAEALVYPEREPDRGPIRLVVIDHGALERDADGLDRLLDRHGEPGVVLLAPATGEVPVGPWKAVVRGPPARGPVTRLITELLPLSAGTPGPSRR